MARVTRHATRRTRERLGIPKKAADSNAEKALNGGFHMDMAKNSLKRYLEGVCREYPPVNNVRVYHRNIYIFNNDILITVMQLPKKYHAVSDKLEREAKEAKETKEERAAV